MEEFPKEEDRRTGLLTEEVHQESRSGGAKSQCRWEELGECCQPARRRRPAPGQERSRRPASY